MQPILDWELKLKDEYKVRHSKIPLPADIGDGPFLQASTEADAPIPPLASVQVFNEPGEDSWVRRLVYGNADCTAFIRVSDIVGRKNYKRVVRYLNIHKRADLRDDVLCIAFIGRKNDIHSHMINDLVGGPVNKAMQTIGDAVTLLEPTISNGSPFTGDGMFNIIMAPIQANYARDFCEKDDFMSGRYYSDTHFENLIVNSRRKTDSNPEWPIKFPFNNGHQKYIMFHGDVGRNILLSFDIVNNNPVSSTLIEFNVYALQMRKSESND